MIEVSFLFVEIRKVVQSVIRGGSCKDQLILLTMSEMRAEVSIRLTSGQDNKKGLNLALKLNTATETSTGKFKRKEA